MVEAATDYDGLGWWDEFGDEVEINWERVEWYAFVKQESDHGHT